MPITFVGAGAFGEHNNADGTPALHASTAQDDLIIVVGFLRGENAQAGAMALVSVGSGYTSIANFTHSAGSPMPRLFAFWKIAGAGEGAPAVNITPLATGASCLYQCATFRGTHLTAPIGVVGASSENASAANIGAITGITALAANGAVIVIGGRCDDWTSVDLLTGDSLTWVEIGDVFTILGQDAGLVWDHAIWSGAAPVVTSKTFTVTGGAANKGLGVMFEIVPPSGINGTASITQSNNTVVVTGTLPIVASTVITQSGDTLSSSGALPVIGILNQTQAGNTLSTTGVLPLNGSVSISQTDNTLVSVGSSVNSGLLIQTQAGDSVSALGTLSVIGTLIKTQANDTLIAQGSAGAVTVGSLVITQAENVMVATGTLQAVGTLIAEQNSNTVLAIGMVAIKGILIVTQSNNTLIAANIPIGAIRTWTLYRRNASLLLNERDNDLNLFTRRRTLKPEEAEL